MTNDPRLARILNHYGERHQQWKLVEETGELLAELGRFYGERTNVADLIHECADVIVVVRQIWPNSEAKSYEQPYNVPETLAYACGLLIERSLRWDEGKKEEAARFILEMIDIFAAQLGELPMLYDAIEKKIARQIERIERETAPLPVGGCQGDKRHD